MTMVHVYVRRTLPSFTFSSHVILLARLSDPSTFMSNIREDHAVALGHNLERAVPLDRPGMGRGGGAATIANGRGLIVGSGGANIGKGGLESVDSGSITLLSSSHVVADFD